MSAFCDLTGLRGLVLGVANEHSIAAAAVRGLHAQGARLLATCLNEKAKAFASPVTEPLGVPLLTCNVAEDGSLEAAVAQAVGQLGGLDFVVHSIAWAPLEDLHGRVTDSSREGFEKAMSISCHSFAELGRLVAPHMSNGGSLITMTYHGADEVVPNYGLMGPVKAALESMVRYMAFELGAQGIRVHAISPGPVPTRAASGLQDFDRLMAEAAKKSPLGRLVSLEEISALTTFLCSPASSGMTGQTIYVDAGYNMMA
ncbi:MAG: enoyl-ACP reductase FabI [Burkholderiaceae bacterium]|jgi:enoyl-[acyl-carrier protein] reductase I